MKSLTCLLAILFVSSTLAFAQGQKASGTVVAVAEKVVTIKAADGKTYDVEVVKVVGMDLKTGDTVEYELVEGKPVNVTKAKKQ
jgi:hypothetical protein